MTSYFQELKAAIRSPSPFVACGILTAFFALSGPFGTYTRFELGQRSLFWAAFLAVTLLWGILFRVFLMTRFPGMSFWRAAFFVSFGSAFILALPFQKFLEFMAGGAVGDAPSMVEIVMTIFVVGIGVSSIRQMFGAPPAVKPAPVRTMPTAVTPAPRLLARIEPELQGQIIRLSARDHYLDVFTEKGSVELLMRFSDALTELEGLDGMQVHRSHWVALGAVTGKARDGDRVFLLTKDGGRVPVSRKHRPELAERGMI